MDAWEPVRYPDTVDDEDRETAARLRLLADQLRVARLNSYGLFGGSDE